MRSEYQCEPDTITYNHLLSCYGSTGKISEGQALLLDVQRQQRLQRKGAVPLMDDKTASIVAKYFAEG